jgi:sialic acid synthase SpsE
MEVIADIGSNWKSLEDCIKAIKFASKDDIDIVKFQFYTHEKLYGGIKPGPPKKRPGELPRAWLSRLHEQCKELKLGFMCSVFHPADVLLINEYVDCHKIASAEATYKHLIDTCVRTDKPVIVSCGCVDPRELSHDVIPMACIAEYPAKSLPIEDLVFLHNQLNNEGIPFGLSDHCTKHADFNYEIAYRMGATFYEFHYNPLNIKSNDSPHSREKFVRPKIAEAKRNKAIARVYTEQGCFRKLDG